MKKESVLIVFWHGIGDCILATPALRYFYEKKKPEKLFIAVNERVAKSGFFDHCEYIDGVLTMENPWEFGSYRAGLSAIKKQAASLAREHGLSSVRIISQRKFYGVHKLSRTYAELGFLCNHSTKTEVFITDKDDRAAAAWLKKKQVRKFVFLHTSSGVASKDLPPDIALRFIKKKYPGYQVISPGVDYSIKKKTIGFSFAILKRASAVVVVDSVFMHAADALRKPIALAYFNFFRGISRQVRPLNVPVHVVKGPMESDLKNRLLWLLEQVLIRVLSVPLRVYMWLTR